MKPVRSKVVAQVESRVFRKIRNQVWDQIRNDAWDQTLDEIMVGVQVSIGKQVEDDTSHI